MPLIDPRPIRIIAAALDARQRSERAAHRRFDYAAFARRARERLAQVDADAGEPPASGSGETPLDQWAQASPDDEHDGGSPGKSPLDLSRDQPARDASIAERLPRATLPVVRAMFDAQSQFVKLAATLATEVASFCADLSITASGNWDVQLPLDKALLPDTILYLSLSPFHLSLRFDTQSALSRQLLLDHSALLQRELHSLLRAWGAPREVELTVW